MELIAKLRSIESALSGSQEREMALQRTAERLAAEKEAALQSAEAAKLSLAEVTLPTLVATMSSGRVTAA